MQAREADEKARALKALASAERPELVQRTLQAAVGHDVAADDAPDLLLDVAQRGGAQLDAAWGFFRECVTSKQTYDAVFWSRLGINNSRSKETISNLSSQSLIAACMSKPWELHTEGRPNRRISESLSYPGVPSLSGGVRTGTGGSWQRSWEAQIARDASWGSCCRALASCWPPRMPHSRRATLAVGCW